MCGRFSFVVDKKVIEKTLPTVKVQKTLLNNYNVAPTQKGYVVTNTNPTDLTEMTWGLIPHWAKDNKMSTALINARMESIKEKPSFKESFSTKRCVVVADSFYEWKIAGTKKKPYRILLKDESPLLMAGIWDEWQGVKTFSIITTEPNAEMATLHNRMPVILRGYADCEIWLGQTPINTLYNMCIKPHDGFLKMYRISDKINSVRYTASDIHKEVPEDLTLF